MTDLMIIAHLFASMPPCPEPLISLPREIILIILENCRYADILVLRRTCRVLRSLCNHVLSSTGTSGVIWYRDPLPKDFFYSPFLDLRPQHCTRDRLGAGECPCQKCHSETLVSNMKVHAIVDHLYIPKPWKWGKLVLKPNCLINNLSDGKEKFPSSVYPSMLPLSLFDPPVENHIWCRVNYKIYRPENNPYHDEYYEPPKNEWQYPFAVVEAPWKLERSLAEPFITVRHFISELEKGMWWQWRIEEKMTVVGITLNPGGDPPVLDIQIQIKAFDDDDQYFAGEIEAPVMAGGFLPPRPRMAWNLPYSMRKYRPEPYNYTPDSESDRGTQYQLYESDSDGDNSWYEPSDTPWSPNGSEFWEDAEEDMSDLELDYEDGRPKIKFPEGEEEAIGEKYVKPDGGHSSKLLAYDQAGAAPYGMIMYFSERRSKGLEETPPYEGMQTRQRLRI